VEHGKALLPETLELNELIMARKQFVCLNPSQSLLSTNYPPKCFRLARMRLKISLSLRYLVEWARAGNPTSAKNASSVNDKLHEMSKRFDCRDKTQKVFPASQTKRLTEKAAVRGLRESSSSYQLVRRLSSARSDCNES
jgi:hypothetical protein